MTAGLTKVVLKDDLLTSQWIDGDERRAFWGIVHIGDPGPGTTTLHNHVAVLTVKDGVANRIDYYHSKEEADKATGLPVYYGMLSDDGNRAVGLMVCCVIEGVEQGREMSLVVALIADAIKAIQDTHPEVTDTAVRERIRNALAEVFLHYYGREITPNDVRPKVSA